MTFVYIIVGLLLLVFAGDALVRGAIGLSLRMGIPALIVSLTVVAIGTSAPELVVAIDAAMSGASGIALGNVVGSNIANVFLVLGVPALIAPISERDPTTRRNYLIMLGATALFVLLALRGVFEWWGGVILLIAMAAMLLNAYFTAKASRQSLDPEDLEGADPHMPRWKIGALIGAGVVGLPIGANLLVEGASELARAFGMSEEVIGLTLVAVGTSLPELAASTAAAMRGRADVAVGNVIGSNICNLLLIIGAAALVAPIEVAPRILSIDLPMMVFAALALAPFIFTERPIGKLVGGVFLAIYAAYTMAALA